MSSFESDIKPLFRNTDRDEMSWAFDLWEYSDVRTRAAEILLRLEQGDMPCDEQWPDARLALFRAWMDADMPA